MSELKFSNCHGLSLICIKVNFLHKTLGISFDYLNLSLHDALYRFQLSLSLPHRALPLSETPEFLGKENPHKGLNQVHH